MYVVFSIQHLCWLHALLRVILLFIYVIMSAILNVLYFVPFIYLISWKAPCIVFVYQIDRSLSRFQDLSIDVGNKKQAFIVVYNSAFSVGCSNFCNCWQYICYGRNLLLTKIGKFRKMFTTRHENIAKCTCHASYYQYLLSTNRNL